MIGQILLFLFLVFFVGSLVFIGFILYRNNQVYKYRLRIINMVHDEAIKAIENGTYTIGGYDILDTVSYDEMVYKFWRPLNSFFPEKYHERKSAK